jgi:hypothetical protein
MYVLIAFTCHDNAWCAVAQVGLDGCLYRTRGRRSAVILRGEAGDRHAGCLSASSTLVM